MMGQARRMGTLKAATLILTGLAGSTLSSDAVADTKIYHGAFCQDDERNRTEYTALGAECHPFAPASQCFVKCPLMRDNVNDENNINVVYVEFYNAPPVSGLVNFIHCSLCTQTEDDESGGFFDCEVHETPTTTGLVQLTFDEVGTFAGDEGSYSLECNLTKDDILVQIHVDEQN